MSGKQISPKLGDQHSPLTVMIVDALRARILSGELAAGQRLVEGRLSEEFGVSRMPVREALRLLSSEGIVTLEPRIGASVTKFSPQQIREMVEVRATLEGLNAKLAAQRHDPGQIAALQRILADGMTLDDQGDPALLIEKNRQFHEALGSVAGNSILEEMMQSLRARTSLLFAPNGRKPGYIRRTWEEHAAILRAVVAGDAELASLLAARHVHSAAQFAPQDEAPRARASG